MSLPYAELFRMAGPIANLFKIFLGLRCQDTDSQFLIDSSCALYRCSLPGEHGLFTLKFCDRSSDNASKITKKRKTDVEGRKICAIRVKCSIVKVDELLCDSVDISHGGRGEG